MVQTYIVKLTLPKFGTVNAGSYFYIMEYKEVFELAHNKGYKEYLAEHLIVPEITSISEKVYQDLCYISLCMLQRWLRDEHKIEVSPYYASAKSIGFHIKRIVDGHVIGRNDGLSNTYEQALLEGIGAALKLIP